MRNRHRYSENWFSHIRPAQLTRAKFKCERCLLKQRSKGYYDLKGVFIHCDEFMCQWATKNGFKVITVHLQVCHIDQNPANNDEKNLAVWCPKCHLKEDHEYNRLTRIAAKAHR